MNVEDFNDLVEEPTDDTQRMVEILDDTPNGSLRVSNDVAEAQDPSLRELSRLQYLLWGKDLKADDDLVVSSDSDSGEDSEAFFSNRKDEMEMYLARSEAWGQGHRDVESIASKGIDSKEGKSRENKDVPGVFTGLDISDAVLPSISSPAKGSPVAAGLSVNSRAGALKAVRRKSSIGVSSIAEEEKDDDLEDGDEDIVERFLQHPKELKFGSVSPVENIPAEVTREMLFNQRSQKVESRLRDEVKATEGGCSSSLKINTQLNDASDSCSNEEDSVRLASEAVSSPHGGALSSYSEYEQGAVKRFSAPFIFKDEEEKDLKHFSNSVNEQTARKLVFSKAELTTKPAVKTASVKGYDPKNPFNLDPSMFEFSDDSDED